MVKFVLLTPIGETHPVAFHVDTIVRFYPRPNGGETTVVIFDTHGGRDNGQEMTESFETIVAMVNK